MLELSDPLDFPLGLVASDFRIEKPCDLIERRQVHSRSLDPRLIDGDRRHDLISFAGQGGTDMNVIKLEHNKNIVKLTSELPEAHPGAIALAVGLRLNVGRAVMARPCAGHPRTAATNLSAAQTSVNSEAYDEAAVLSWMAGSSPAITEKQSTISTHT